MHGDWSGEVNQTAGATETSAGGPGERDVGVLEDKRSFPHVTTGCRPSLFTSSVTLNVPAVTFIKNSLRAQTSA